MLGHSKTYEELLKIIDDLERENQSLKVIYDQDITDRKLAGKELRKLSLAVQQSPVSVVITDVRGIIEYVNPKTTEITGYAMDELIGQNPRIFSSGEIPKESYKILWETIISGKEWRGEFHNKKKNGELYWESASISSIVNENNIITNFLAVKEDITEKKLMEQYLIAAKEKSEIMNRLKSNFLENMSHELRTPLVSINGFSEILKEELTDPAMKDMANQINIAGTRLTNTLISILDLAKLEAEKIEFKFEEIDIVKETKVVIDALKPLADRKGLNLNSIFCDTNVSFRSDINAFHSILTNLVDNAIKFTNWGEIILEYTRSSGALIIKVTDTGIGIAEEHLQYIFDEFRQVSEGFDRKFEGNGLGLSVTKKIVENLGGTISVKSEPGVGTTFIVELPITNNIGKLTKLNGVQKAKETLPFDQDSEKLPVLLVDDYLPVFKVLMKVLGNRFDLDYAENGEVALKFVNKKEYFFILMDINLGRGKDGVQITQEIRKNNKYHCTPIVAMTAYAMPRDKEKFLASGFSHYISKPFTHADISQLADEILMNRQQSLHD